MPNWCYNIIEVTGNEKDLKSFVKKIKGKDRDFDFNTIIPYPKEYAVLDKKCNKMRDDGVNFKDIPKDGYNNGGYSWCISNWGTKWNAVEPDVSVEKNIVQISFDTAWSPSINITEKLSEMFKTLEFKHKYEEGGCDFSGTITLKNGVTLSNISGLYNDFPISSHDWQEDLEGEI